MAISTWEALSAREVQAEPLETAMPLLFSSISMDSPSINSTQKLAWPGSALLRVAGNHNMLDFCRKLPEQAVADACQMLHPGLHIA